MQQTLGRPPATAASESEALPATSAAHPEAAGQAALERILASPLVVEAKQQVEGAVQRMPLTRELLSMMHVDASTGPKPASPSEPTVAHAPTPSLPLAADPKAPHGDRYGTVEGTAFVRQPGDASDISENDIAQGDAGDCFLLSAMAAVAHVNPEAIRRLVKDNGDGTYDVTLYFGAHGWDNKTAHTIRVDSRFLTTDGDVADAQPRKSKGAPDELWPLLIEKAYAMLQHGYKALEVGGDKQGLEALLPGKSEVYDIHPAQAEQAFERIAKALAERRPVLSGTSEKFKGASKHRADELRVADDHAYSVMSVDPARKTISLHNPWGEHHLDDLPLHDYVTFFTDYEIGPKL